jgi:hypothetical protein
MQRGKNTRIKNLNPKYFGQLPNLDELPSHPVWDQIKPERVRIGDMLDCSEINREVRTANCIFFDLKFGTTGQDFGDMVYYPLKDFVWENPIYEVDDPILKWEPPNQVPLSLAYMIN